MARAGEPHVVLVRGDSQVASWPLPEGNDPDLALVDQLARLQLWARRLGCLVRVHHPSAELRELLDLVGLTDVLTAAPGSPCRPLEVGGEAKDLEQGGIEEVVMPDDPIA